MNATVTDGGVAVESGAQRSSAASDFPTETQYRFAAQALRNHAAELSEGEFIASRTYINALLAVARHIDVMTAGDVPAESRAA